MNPMSQSDYGYHQYRWPSKRASCVFSMLAIEIRMVNRRTWLAWQSLTPTAQAQPMWSWSGLRPKFPTQQLRAFISLVPTTDLQPANVEPRSIRLNSSPLLLRSFILHDCRPEYTVPVRHPSYNLTTLILATPSLNHTQADQKKSALKRSSKPSQLQPRLCLPSVS